MSKTRKKRDRKRAHGDGRLSKRTLQTLGWIAAGVIAAGVVVAFVIAVLSSSSSGGSSVSESTPTPDPRVAGATPNARFIVEADDDGQQVNTRFTPNTITGRAGDVIEITVNNVGSVAHNLRISGVDREYDTDDDFATMVFGSIQPGKSAKVLLKIEPPGTYPFRCDLHPTQQTGTLALR